jgi:hypothetical protein
MNIIIFYGEESKVLSCEVVSFDTTTEGYKFIKENNSEYDGREEMWNLAFNCSNITELILNRDFLEKECFEI